MTRPARPAIAFGMGAAVGTGGGPIGPCGAEVRLPALIGALRVAPRVALRGAVARIGAAAIAAPASGTFHGMLRDGSPPAPGDKPCEVDPCPARLAVFTGIGRRPAAIAAGVAQALDDRPFTPAKETDPWHRSCRIFAHPLPRR